MTNDSPESLRPRRLIKNFVEGLFSALPDRLGASASLVLAYHNIVHQTDTGRGDGSLHLALPDFERQLKIARQMADVVDLPTLFRERGAPGRRIAVTFDDAYLGAVTHGLPVCATFGIVPTVFVSPGLYGSTPPWDRRAEQGKWSADARDRFLRELKGRDVAPVQVDPTLPQSYSIAEPHVLLAALHSQSFHVGNHSQTHANLGALSETELLQELTHARANLQVFGDAVVPFVAFPYGIPPQAALDHVLAVACDAAFLVSGGWMTERSASSPLRLPRLNVPAGITEQGFRARLKGWA